MVETSRFKIVYIVFTVLALSRVALALLEKSTFIELLGWLGMPLISIFATIIAGWFIILAIAISLVFWDQSSTPLMTVAIVAIIAIILKSLELGWSAIP